MPINFEKQEPMKVETIKLDSERLEIVREILEQNKKILNFILEPTSQLHLVSGTSVGSDTARDINDLLKGAMAR